MCVVNARQGSTAFANDWQWLVGFPALAAILWFFRAYLSNDTQHLLSGTTAFGTFMAALIAFLLTMLACFVIRLFIWPPILYYEEKDRADAAKADLQRRFTPQISIFLNPDYHGVIESPTEIQGQRGPSSMGSFQCFVRDRCSAC